jgi:hypothetical protein
MTLPKNAGAAPTGRVLRQRRNDELRKAEFAALRGKRREGFLPGLAAPESDGAGLSARINHSEQPRAGEATTRPAMFASILPPCQDYHHDPRLDPMAMAFAIGEFAACETALVELIGPGGSRQQHVETWLTLFDFYRAIDARPGFEALAIDYRVNFEAAPPPWEALCGRRSGGAETSSTEASGPSTDFMPTLPGLPDDGGSTPQAELRGHLSGDISALLDRLSAGKSGHLTVDCQQLLRIDFAAAGDLLNWVICQRSEKKRSVKFKGVNRLLAAFLKAVGLAAHSEVEIRQD